MSAALSTPIMRERPILFSGAMVKAILGDRKTVTRRICRVQPEPWKAHHAEGGCQQSDWTPAPCDDGTWDLISTHAASTVPGFGRCPFGAHGERLWVRETWAPQPGREESVDLPEYDGGKNPDALCYRADECRPGESTEWPEGLTFGVRKWRPSIFLPRWASRITLAITDVRVERLHAITEDDACAEGVEPDFGNAYTYADRDYRRAFERLWDAINGKRANFASNPWVWRVAFAVVKP